MNSIQKGSAFLSFSGCVKAILDPISSKGFSTKNKLVEYFDKLEISSS